MNATNPIKGNELATMPKDYFAWRKNIVTLIEQSKLRAIQSVNSALLSLYWHIGRKIIEKQQQRGWGAQVIAQLSRDLTTRFPDDRGYSVTNLKYMRGFALQYPQYPILQVPLAELTRMPISQVTLDQLRKGNGEFGQVRLDQIDWYHHISLIPKVKTDAERVYRL